MTTNKNPPPSTKQSLPIALLRARERVMGPIRGMLTRSGITEQQWRILGSLDELGPLDATKLADAACLPVPSQTRIVQTLVEKGYVTRTPDIKDLMMSSTNLTISKSWWPQERDRENWWKYH